jgi:hypothetical protein
MMYRAPFPTSPRIAGLALLLGGGVPVSAQQWVNPHYDAHRLDFRDLGYPTQNLIPADDSFVTALLAHSNGLVYGATSGREHAYLFLYNRYVNKVRPLGRLPGGNGVHHALLEAADGSIYIGTGLNVLAPVRPTRDFPVEYEAIVKHLWQDIKRPYEGYPGGHLLRYDPRTGDARRYTADDACPVEDLGIPVPANTVYALTSSPDRRTLYGISYPDAHFFIFDPAARTTRDLGEFLARRVYGGPERHWRSVPRALYCDPVTGRLLTSGDNGWFVACDPGTGRIEPTAMRLPGEYWESFKSVDYPVVENFVRDAAGRVYAGSSDGYLVRLDLATERTVVLGKPRVQRRLRALAAGRDGQLYLVCGETDLISKFYRYDPEPGGGFHDLGVIAVDRSPYYAKRAYRIDAMAVGADGTVFLGESDRREKLFLYTPGAEPFPGDMNPTNPVVERMRPGTPALIPEAL